MNVREIKPKGIFRIFKSSVYEATAAREEKEQAVDVRQALKTHLAPHENINYTADERIHIPPVQKEETPVKTVPTEFVRRAEGEKKDAVGKDWALEERLENLQNILEKSLSGEDRKDVEEMIPHLQENFPENSEGFLGMKMIYKVLLDNEVDEKYVNQIIDDVEKVVRSGSSMDMILSNVYQKLILKFGQPGKIELVSGQPRWCFLLDRQEWERRPRLQRSHPNLKWIPEKR